MLRLLSRCRFRILVVGLFGGSLLFGLSCTGPAPDQGGAANEPARVYHVQLNQTKEKEAANRDLARAIAWWDDRASTSLPTPRTDGQGESPVQVMWRAPFYRVRLGPFESRSAASKVLTEARSAFPKAFIAPERREERE